MPSPRSRAEDGAAVVDFVLVSTLLCLLVAGVLQLAVAVHVRNTLVDCAGEGARVGARVGAGADAAVERTRALVAADLSPSFAVDVEAGREEVDGLDTVVVRVRAPLPVAGLLGPGRVLVVEGHAVRESQESEVSQVPAP